MKAVMLCGLVILIASLSSVASAQKKPSNPRCDNAQTQFDMNQCAHEDFAKSDAALNVTYRKLMAQAGQNGAQYQQKLKEAQLAWIKYRDTTCESEAQLNEGGTMYPMVYDYCLTSVTDERNKRLKEQLATWTQ